MTTAWERLSKVIEWSGMSANFFAHHIGFNRAEVIYQIKFGKIGISLRFAQRVAEYFPQISVGWLISGEGSMFVSEDAKVPLYASIDSLNDANATPEMQLSVPNISSCYCAYRNADDAMAQEVKEGEVVFLAKTDINALDKGVLCVVEHPDFVLLRQVADADGESLRLAATSAQVEDVVLRKEDVKSAYRVVGRMIMYN
jgi:hypothetical protein